MFGQPDYDEFDEKNLNQYTFMDVFVITAMIAGVLIYLLPYVVEYICK